MLHIDLRSDTATEPTQSMKQAIQTYKYHQQNNQCLMKALESEAAQIMGKQNGCFVPSGTFGNQCSLLTIGSPGDQVLLSDACHIIQYQNGSIGGLSRLVAHTLPHTSGKITLSTLKQAFNKKGSKPKIFCIQNSTTKGSLYSIEQFINLTQLAKQKGCHVHMDGARIFNACSQLKIQPKNLLKYVDSVMFCLSKGLCAPVGSMVVGSNDFISKFKINATIMGGKIRKPGILASIGLISLREMRHQVINDNQKARILSQQMSKIKWITITEKVQTNMIFFKFNSETVIPSQIATIFQANSIKCIINPSINVANRFVIHYYITNKQIQLIIKLLKEYDAKINKGQKTQ